MKQGILKLVRDGVTKLRRCQAEGRDRLLAVPVEKFDAGRKFTIRLLQREPGDCAA